MYLRPCRYSSRFARRPSRLRAVLRHSISASQSYASSARPNRRRAPAPARDPCHALGSAPEFSSRRLLGSPAEGSRLEIGLDVFPGHGIARVQHLVQRSSATRWNSASSSACSTVRTMASRMKKACAVLPSRSAAAATRAFRSPSRRMVVVAMMQSTDRSRVLPQALADVCGRRLRTLISMLSRPKSSVRRGGFGLKIERSRCSRCRPGICKAMDFSANPSQALAHLRTRVGSPATIDRVERNIE